MPESSDLNTAFAYEQNSLMPHTWGMNKGQFVALTGSCGAFFAFVATGGEAMVFVQRLVASLPI